MSTITTHNRTRRVVAAVGAIALGLIGVAGLAGPASADTVSGVGNIDSSKSGQPGTGIVVHKYEKTTGNGTAGGTGVELGAAPGGADPIAGARFTITPVRYSGTNIDPLTNVGWTQAATAQASFLPATATFSNVNVSLGTESAQQVTTGAGLATFDSLPFGVYLVQERTPLANQVISPAQPFLVTVPFPTAATAPTNTWLYTVHAFPKNAVTGIDKVVNSSESGFLTAGDYVSWTITNDVPVLATGGTLNSFVVTDTVTDNQLDFVPNAGLPAGIAPRSVVIRNAAGTDISGTFTAGTDYTLTPSTPTATNTQTVLTFTSTGLAKLAAAPVQGGKVVLVVPTKVVTVPANGTVTNDSSLDVNSAHLTDPASTDFGQLRVLKYALADVAGTPTRTPLAGATFSLYVDLDQDGVADPGETDSAARVTVNGQNTWTSASVTGLLNIPALKVGRYLLVETVAPVGYQLDTTPHPVNVTAGLSTTSPAVNYLEIANSQVPPWLLPFTGGNGVATFTIAGAGLMALALGFAFVVIRRRKQAEQV